MLAVATESFKLMPDWTLLLQLANFLVVVATLSVFVFKPLLKVIERRAEFTTGAKADADKMVDDATQMDIGRKQVLAMALSEAQADREKKLAQAQRDADDLIAEARDKSHKILSENEAALDKIKKSLDQDADKCVDEIAAEIMKRVMK